ncbi:terpene synthase [Saccharopolyspora sp. ASAGF58]|uniref:terpene synthase family protein n=1 Tax=Saccharopolyspora sp. ASAGF58 TaxID=2719023 RepID=UPI00143FC0BB|nr:terpene synthase [Saccharopolyspora sp. ASAGF58]QIZ35970.1 terpene synthase [Saccharopolyspora sp. ASAGF58]
MHERFVPAPITSRAAADAAEAGRICALALRAQIDLHAAATATEYAAFFPDPPIGPQVYSGIAVTNAFISPWSTSAELRLLNRAASWVFAIDLLIDHRATEQTEVDQLIAACLSAAGGTADPHEHPGARFLSALRNDLRTADAFPALEGLWLAELQRMLAAMAQEWRWKTAAAGASGATRPSLSDYLDNADNYGTVWINLTHWIHNGHRATLAHLDELLHISRVTQQIMRLRNDLGTYQRDVDWHDLNALMLADRPEVEQTIGHLSRSIQQPLAHLGATCPHNVQYLQRQADYITGFYAAGGEFWSYDAVTAEAHITG